ncbi:condensation domain-containing protein, partial [Kitasatospora sp. MBT63]|uniref:condensation domain-containing protein n=1 Tax=Kitasatospora sp. MBT63 TaxID=1444768 RepID=UPI0018F52EB7
WRTALAGAPELLELPVNRARPAELDPTGDLIAFDLDPEIHQALTALARECGATVFMVVQAAVAALLSRLGAGVDIPLGTPVAGRTDQALDELVGFFVNTLVLRTDVSGDPTFRELVGRVRDADLAAFAHQDVPFERLVEVLNPVRSMDRHPLFQVMLTFAEETVDDGPQLPGLTVKPLESTEDTAKFDLSFGFVERADHGLAGSLEFSVELFDRVTAESLVVRLVRLLAGVVADPDGRVGGVELLAVEERGRLLGEWNGASVPSEGVLFAEVFERRAAESPDAVALVAVDGVFSFGEVNARANRLARELVARGAGAERCVALVLPRTSDLLVGLLAVLKSGAAYLPLDPSHPVDRIGFMVGDARPVLAVAVGSTAG